MPSPVRAVEIPKDHGTGVRVLGVPTTADRVAQTAVAMLLEEKLEPIFHPDSYGYRPGRSAHDALAVTRRRCWEKDWVLDLDIRSSFDSVPHDLLLQAVARHTRERWVLLYIERWLRAPMRMPDGTLDAREKGTPQGSPISPLLANLFLTYAFDRWMTREHPGCPFERYADDSVVHCATEKQVRRLWVEIAKRLETVGLELHPEKTKVVYCTPASTFSAIPSGDVRRADREATSSASRQPSRSRLEERSARRSGHGIFGAAAQRTWPASQRKSIRRCVAGSATTEPSIAPSCTSSPGASTSILFDGPGTSSNDSGTPPSVHGPGWPPSNGESRDYLRIGRERRHRKADLQEPYDGRLSRTVL
jgi:group II intron reverse transcriptase/maturase